MTSLQEHADLSTLNTFRLPATVRWLAGVADAAELSALLGDPRFAGLPRLVLGGGSNLVLRGTEIDALMVRFVGGGWREVARAGTKVRIAVDAGMRWHDLVRETVVAGLGGIENLALIPGTVGAAPVQNIGAYGVELASVVQSVDTVDLRSGERRSYSVSECAFGYRDSIFKHAARSCAITGLELALATDAPLQVAYRDIQEEWRALGEPTMTRALVFDMVCAIRRRKLPDPEFVGNAGSFFKNPLVGAAHFDKLRAQFPDVVGYPQADGQVKLAAGWLIDRAGWKGREADGVGVHERQALVLVNRGGATGAAVLALAKRIVADIRERYGVELEMEPVVL